MRQESFVPQVRAGEQVDKNRTTLRLLAKHMISVDSATCDYFRSSRPTAHGIYSICNILTSLLATQRVTIVTADTVVCSFSGLSLSA